MSETLKKIFETVLPIKVISEANQCEHWRLKHARKKKQQAAIQVFWNTSSIFVSLPCHIKLTRIAPRSLDSDNLVSSFKFIRDKLADMIKPGLKPGQADSKDFIFEYDQKKGLPKEYLIKIEIFKCVNAAEEIAN